MDKVILAQFFSQLNFNYIDIIYYFPDNDFIYSMIYNQNDVVIIIDVNICNKHNNQLFSYYDYVNTQNYYVKKFDAVYRFYVNKEDDLNEIKATLKLFLDHQEQYDISDLISQRDKTYVDNSPIEYQFEEIFSKVYGKESLSNLEKEYSLTTLNGKTLFSDYVLETFDQKYAIEENGVTYHHPQIILEHRYRNQLEKQNSLIYYKFKVYRWSSEHFAFSNILEDNIKNFFGDKSSFINKFAVNQNRKFELYDHQIDILEVIEEKRKNEIKAFLVVIPTATGKSQIAIEDITREYQKKGNLNVLIASPTTQLKKDWDDRLFELKSKINIENLTYISAYNLINQLNPDFFDYLVIDEAHHAVTPTCKKIIKYFNPEFMLGLTATPERLDKQKLEDVFGSFNTKLTLKEAIENDIIAPIRAFRVESNINLSEIRYNGMDYRNSDIERAIRIESRNELIVKVLDKYFSRKNKKQGIIFCVNINHANEMSKVCNDFGIKAAAVYGGNSKNEKHIDDYRNKKIQFLCSCNMISEGWDEPSTEVVVMARPTLSKVLYLQQIGRGLRKYPKKEALYIIDVVDQYGMLLKPWTIHSIFNIGLYKPFADILDINKITDEMMIIQGLVENEISIKEIDIETFEEKYKDYLSVEQLARALFVSTGTVNSWIKKKEIIPEVKYKINKTELFMFAPYQISDIRKIKNLKDRTDETIKDDFFEFLNDKNYTFSFKMVFLLSFLKVVNNEGEAIVDQVISLYTKFYKNRIEQGLPVDKKTCIYTEDFLNDQFKVKQSLFSNPFEKFERKRFVYHCKDLNKIAFNPILWDKISKEHINEIKSIYFNHLNEYYEKYQGLNDVEYLR